MSLSNRASIIFGLTVRAVLFGALIVAIIPSAHAKATGTFSVTAHVKPACWLKPVTSNDIEAGTANLGEMKCNFPGYTQNSSTRIITKSRMKNQESSESGVTVITISPKI